jgi:N4-gp56 family major capsid protein
MALALASDDLIKKATTLTSTLSHSVPKFWQGILEANLRKSPVGQQSLVQNTDLLVPNSGDTTYIPILDDIGQADVLTEGTDMAPIALTSDRAVFLQPTEYGKVVEITRKALDRIKFDGMAAIIDRLAYSMTLRIENMIFALWNATQNLVGGGGAAMADKYPNGHTSANIVAADTFNDVLLFNGLSTLMAADNQPWPDGYYRCYMTPAQYLSLIQDTNTRQDIRWAAPQRLLNGEVGALHGVRIIVTNFIATATENSITVYKAILCAPRWAAIGWKRRPEVYTDPTLYDGGRKKRFGVTADFDVQLVHNERAVVLTSA